MAYIKKLIMQGFKSFARKTEIEFDKGINVVLGPNGAGKSNIADALCFALGRISIKSIRAAKAKNLIFMGSKYIKPAKEAFVEIIFDNSDRAFNIDKDEIHLTRIVRSNGQGIYKINGETKTRTEILEMLAQAGIDPHGFNLVLQGQIQSVVRMHPEDRRGIIEEAAGISVYESRKEKSLHELEKTEARLKEISTVLRERSAYLKNLEKEKAQAQRYKELETTVKRAKAGILHRRIDMKEKEIQTIIRAIEQKMNERDKVKGKAEKIQSEINYLTESIRKINKHIEESSGLEQESLRDEIANLKANLEGLKVRKESYENRKNEIERRIEELEKDIPELESEIKELRNESPKIARKAEELRKKKDELRHIEEERRKFLSLKSELNSIKERIKDKEKQLIRAKTESESLIKQIEEFSSKLNYQSAEKCKEAIEHFKNNINEKRKELDRTIKEEIENEKIKSISLSEIQRAEEIKKKVSSLEICPICQSKISEEHIKHVNEDSDSRIKKAKEEHNNAEDKLDKLKELRANLRKELDSVTEKISLYEKEFERHKLINDKKELLKRIVNEEKEIESEIKKLDERQKNLEQKSFDINKIEEQYERKILEIEEISSRTEEDVDTSLLYKERELENTRNIIKRSQKDLEDIEEQINELISNIKYKNNSLDEREKKESELNNRFKKMLEDRGEKQNKIQNISLELSEIQREIREIEDQINHLKIGKAKFDAEKEALQMEIQEFTGVEILQGSVQYLEERLHKSQEILQTIGSINMRALEVYEQVKKEYDSVYDKVLILEKEKDEIMKIIEEIDKKKKRTFMKTFNAINELFSRNFSKLSAKGTAYLDIENNEDIFSGGVNIVVKLAKGKYFDVTSLSGGEQTLVALSLLFAIQEYKPYHFYVLDEIDAALDKRNSERLATLLNQYMKSGQYIIVTHNDAIIMNSNLLYGVSMHDGVSKILSLQVK